MAATEAQLASLAKVREKKAAIAEERKSLNQKIDEELGLEPGTSDKLAKVKTPDEVRNVWLQGLLIAFKNKDVRHASGIADCIPIADAIMEAYEGKFFKK